MVFGTPLADFLLRWILILTVITIIILSPFFIKLALPDQYKGIWKLFGDALRTPKRALVLPLGMLIGLSLIVGLSVITTHTGATTSATLDRTSTSVFSDLITIKGVQVQHKSDVRFGGESALPDGTCILTQLYEDEQPLVWWPTDRCAQVKFGRWEIHVRLSEEQGAPGELSETEMYILRAWQKDDPAIEAQYFPFDLQGPPPESALHSTVPSQTSSEPGKTPPGQEQGSDCSQVERIPPDSTEARAIGQDLIATNPRLAGMETPPLFAEIRSIDRLGKWILFQASFESQLEPAIFVLQGTATGYRYVTLWGGQAQDAAEIRSALAAEEASLPPALLACLQPAEWFLPAPVAPTVRTFRDSGISFSSRVPKIDDRSPSQHSHLGKLTYRNRVF